MRPGPILSRELLTAARRSRTYHHRVSLAVLALVIFGANGVGWWYWRGDRLSVGEVARFARITFAGFAAAQVFLAMMMIPTTAGRLIAEERDRRTLVNLLTTGLSSFEIIVGKLAAGLVEYAACVLGGVPVAVGLARLGGIDPRLIGLVYAGTASTALVLAALATLVSAVAKSVREAVGVTTLLATLWWAVPMPASFLVPKLLPGVAPYVAPISRWLLWSSPMVVLTHLAGISGGGGGLPEVLAWMIGLQLAASLLFVLGAVAWLRPASRRREGGEGPVLRRWANWRLRPWPRPAVGDDPMLWKERYTSRGSGLTDLLGVLGVLVVLGGLGYGTYRLARPAVAEVWASGYGSTGVDEARHAGSRALRFVSGVIGFMLVLLAAGVSAESIALERTRDTWSGVLATPLSGREILRAKRLGVLWRLRLPMAVLVGLWAVGLVAGALHPIGFAAALVALVVSTRALVALGTHASLISADRESATNRALLPVMLLLFSPLASLAVPRLATVFLGAGSPPVLGWLALVSYRDVRGALGEGTWSSEAMMGLATGEGAARVLATYLLGILGYAALGIVFRRRAEARFDEAVGRPVRPNADPASRMVRNRASEGEL